MITRKAVLVAFAIATSEIGARAQAPAPSNPGLSAEQIDFLRRTALADQAKNVYPNAQALADVMREGVKGIGKAIADGVADQMMENAAGVDSPNAAVTDAAKKIVKTENLFGDMADWRTVTRGKQASPDAAPQEAANEIRAIDPSALSLKNASLSCAIVDASPNDVLCNPNQQYTLYCSFSGARVPGTADANYSNGAIAYVCKGKIVATIGAWNRFPPAFNPWVKVINGSDTLLGFPFAGPCRPATTEKCAGGDFLKQLFGR